MPTRSKFWSGPVAKFAFRDRDRLLGMIGFDRLPSPYRCLLMLPQDRTETILLDRMAGLGVSVLRGASFSALRQTADGVTVWLTTPDGPAEVTARYVVGTDGMHSDVRAACDIPFDGAAYEGSFVLADATLDGAPKPEEVTLYFSPEGLVVVAPLPGGRHRIVATVDEAPEHPDAALVQDLLDRRGPSGGRLGQVRDVAWSSRFHLHHRLARTYRKGRVFLAGDAAHAHSPAGGQGMNTGLVDAHTLGRLMAEVIQGRAPEADLDRYEALRRPAAARVLDLAGRLTGAATVKAGWKRQVRNLALRVLSRFGGFRRRLALNLSGIARRSAAILD
jgi:2-polyprenyl-6-methoxyphenol hydroxylase-like FAD-dependent oxidoreductase